MKNDPDIQERSNLTRSQLLFWAGQKLRPAEPLYNMVVCYSVPVRVDTQRLQAAWQTLVDSSDALRTIIEERDGVPMQTVLPRIVHTLEFVDLSGRDASGWIHERSRMVFDLEKRLFDGALIKVADQDFIIYISHHQIIGDAWSSYLIYRRLSELYDGQAVESPPFRQYIDFERETRGSTRYQKAQGYWKQQLDEPADEMKLYGEAAGATTRGRRLTRHLSRELVEKLRSLALRKDVFIGTPDLSLFVLFISIFFAYLNLVSGARRLSLGIMHHNRITKAFADTIGMFMEVLPLRITIAGDETFATLIKKTTKGVLDGLKHGQFTTGNPIQNANYHVSLNYINASLPEFDGTPVSAEWVHTGYQNEILDLHVRQWNSAGDLVLEFDLDSDLFSEEEQREAMRHFELIMDAAVNDFDAAIDHGLLMSESQKERFAVLLSEASFAFEATKRSHKKAQKALKTQKAQRLKKDLEVT
jgi:hypothetical protein